MVKKGPWTPEEDMLLTSYIQAHGVGQWRTLPKKAGLQRCGKGCRLRWMNYLRPNVKRGNISLEEEELIIRLHKLLGNRWSLIAGRVPGRTDNEIKNYWNTRLSKKLRLGSEAPRYSRKTNGSSHPRSYSSIPQENASAFCNKNDINSGDDDPEKPMCRQNPSTSLLEELLGLGSCNTQLQQQQQQDTNSTGGRHEQTVAEENNYNVATALLQDSFFQDDLNLVWSSSDIGNNPMWLSADPATDQFQDENQRFFMIQQQHNSNSNINNHNGGSNHNGLDLQYCLNNQNVSFLPAATLFKTHEDGDDTANTNNNNNNNTNNAVVLQSHQECLLDNPCSSPWPGYYFFLA